MKYKLNKKHFLLQGMCVSRLVQFIGEVICVHGANTVAHSIIFKATSDDELGDQYYWISDTENQMWLSV